ncbi:MNIO family bufferin maturase [Hydrogenophaga sp.]|uniref:MNIO family bufferin maturase n=1 Tax=Hydrogenophaga sp. TaxID=1904254 RepID=UPI002FC7B824
MTAADLSQQTHEVATVGIGWRHPHYAELLLQQPALDFIEVHSENFFAPGGAARAVLRHGREHYPVSLHGVGLSLGSTTGIDDAHLNQLAALVTEIEPVRVSDHASFARGPLSHQSLQTVHASDLLPTPFTRAALDAMCANVQRVQDRLRRPIAVENLSAYVRWQANELNEPEFLNTLAQRTGCGLLVDVNNIFVNALNDRLLGSSSDPLTSCQRWLDTIDPHAVSELHLAGHVDCGDIVIDDHGSRVVPEVWVLYRHALERFGAVPTLIEWDTGVPELSVLLDEAATAREHARHPHETVPA